MSTPKTPGNPGKRLQSAKGPAGGSGSGAALVSSSSLLDVFPVWSEQQVSEKEDKNAGQCHHHILPACSKLGEGHSQER